MCGCPLVKDVFELTGDFCRVPKRKCNRHYCWEKLRRAEVDLERVRVVGIRSCLSTRVVVMAPDNNPIALYWNRLPSSEMSAVLIDYMFLLAFWQWYKLDELFEQERNVRMAMTNRAGLLALMLHQTIQHDPLTTDLRTSTDR